MKPKNRIFTLGTLITLCLLYCCINEKAETSITSQKPLQKENYKPTIFPKDTTKLWIGEGDKQRDTVLIILEGGPHNQLNFDWSGRTVWSALPDYFNYYRVHVHQATSFNKSIYRWNHEFTPEMAELEVENGTEFFARAMDYFKKRNKKIIVVGTSWGAQVMLHYIAKHNQQADKYLISAGRLDATPMQVKYHFKGYNSKFQQDGKTLMFPDTTRTYNTNRGEYFNKLSRVKQLMKGVMGKHSFTEELADKDLSNVVFAYATNDAQIGALTDKELTFLKGKNIPVFTTDKGHAGPDRLLIELVKDGIIKL